MTEASRLESALAGAVDGRTDNQTVAMDRSPIARSRYARIRELDHVIDSLANGKKSLKDRISQETGHTRLRRLNLALAVTDLQHKKALALREELRD